MCGARYLKHGLGAGKPSSLTSPYIQNIYQIEVQYLVLVIGHLRLSCEFFFQIFCFFPFYSPVVDIIDIHS